uniref:1-acylglycerol-3-phosphate O-acyltransferase ABHD5 n=2 Tax=Cacopsylla melanoneura TaxID=428564 RepID=A0A8D9BAX2_9HEMI
MTDEGLAVYRPTWLWSWFWWAPMSATALRSIEKKILSFLKTPYKSTYVDIGPVVGTSDKVWTVSLNTEETQKTPLVLLHGLGAGVALWCLNLDSFAAHRPVYALDILGFGRSSRPRFSTDPEAVERQLVTSIEEWRKELQLKEMILLGHSFGGYLAYAYAIQYPDRVKHLILADPWGFPQRSLDPKLVSKIPLWARMIGNLYKNFNPLWPVRFVGPLGQWVVEKMRPDLPKKFIPVLGEESAAITEYIFQCNVQAPSGESAFHTLTEGLGYAKRPMLHRVDQLAPTVPVTVVYGSRSWVDNSSGDKIKEARSKACYVNVKSVTGAGHHVYADRADVFNKMVNDACNLSDKGEDVVTMDTKAVIKVEPSGESKQEEEEEEEGEQKKKKKIKWVISRFRFFLKVP